MTTSVRRSAELHHVAAKILHMPTGAPLLPEKESAAIMRLAAQIEQSFECRLRWFTDDPIDSLGGLTAAELIALGRGDQVRMFLHRIIYPDGQGLLIY